jgi:hypothetical protein
MSESVGFPAVRDETLGRLVHETRLACEADRAAAEGRERFRLSPWEERDGWQRELDMRIGEAVAAAGRERFREQARILGEQKTKWLCEACDCIHPWRDGDRFTADCPECGWPMVPTSESLRALMEARSRAVAAEARLAALRGLCDEYGWMSHASWKRRVLAIIGDGSKEENGNG